MIPIRREESEAGLRLELPAAHEAGREARALLRDFVSGKGVEGRELETFEFVAGELLDNAIDHGGGRGARRIADLESGARVSAQLSVDDKRWVLRVQDQGGDSVDQARERLLAAEVDKLDPSDERGRGLFLLKGMVDELDVRSSEDGSGLVFRAERDHAGQG